MSLKTLIFHAHSRQPDKSKLLTVVIVLFELDAAEQTSFFLLPAS
jgi:hypothetical protein